MRKGLVQIAMDKGDITLRHGLTKLPYREIRREGAFILGNIGVEVLGKSVSVSIRGDVSDEHGVIMVYEEGVGDIVGILAKAYKKNLSAVQVLREIYQKIRGY